ncbi:T9SS type A sorting domain-containing protein [Chitinophagaceae bacterium MMS25-I14]
MNKIFTLIIIVLFSSSFAKSQIIFRGQYPIDSAVFSFTPGDSLSWHDSSNYTLYYASLDTTGTQLWEIGNTAKPFFAAGGNVRSIMTDTAVSYPVNANDFFILKFFCDYGIVNPIISFRHKYQTAAGMDGCIVEFSNDSGATWQNVAGDCNVANGSSFLGIITENFYSKNDTLASGEPAFSSNSGGWQVSRLQFFQGFPVKGTSTCDFNTELYLRFRFKSDAVADTLDGWLIDSIQVNYDYYGSSVQERKAGALAVYPNPVTDVLHMPALPGAAEYRVTMFNVFGQQVLSVPYNETIHTGQLPPGTYFYQVSNGIWLYSGTIVKE